MKLWILRSIALFMSLITALCITPHALAVDFTRDDGTTFFIQSISPSTAQILSTLHIGTLVDSQPLMPASAQQLDIYRWPAPDSTSEVDGTSDLSPSTMQDALETLAQEPADNSTVHGILSFTLTDSEYIPLLSYPAMTLLVTTIYDITPEEGQEILNTASTLHPAEPTEPIEPAEQAD